MFTGYWKCFSHFNATVLTPFFPFSEHVCSWQEQVSRLTSKLTSEQYVTTERYNTTCGWLGRKCTKTRTV